MIEQGCQLIETFQLMHARIKQRYDNNRTNYWNKKHKLGNTLAAY